MVISWVHGVQFRGYALYSGLCLCCACVRVFTSFSSVPDTVSTYAVWAIEVWQVLGWVTQSVRHLD